MRVRDRDGVQTAESLDHVDGGAIKGGDAIPQQVAAFSPQQKGALAKCLLTNPSVLLLDEPTRGIDVGAKAEIHALMDALAGRGTAILAVSSELPELIGMCDRIVVLCEGRVTGEFHRDPANGAAATQEAILTAAMMREAVHG